ncbi:MAG TPA: rod shape-determining protein MreD [Candidatus Sumerlaeota bacterium]|nr:rod shape-determining protein MreD [Candidatus Sumerlaeota bacterium]
MKYLKTVPLFLAALILDFICLRPGLTHALYPRPLLLFVILAGLEMGDTAGMITGVLVGFFHTFLYADPSGISSLVYALAGWQAGRIGPYIIETPGIIPFLVTFCLFLIADVVFSLLITMFHQPFLSILPLQALSGGLLFGLSYPGMHRYLRTKGLQMP